MCSIIGKSTLLRILAGRHLTKPEGAVKVLGMNAFRDTKLNFHRAYLDCDWGLRTVAFAGAGVPLMADIPVHGMMTKLQNSYPERRDELVEMLGIDVNWRMHQLSDGQRRRVQLLLGLVRPFKLLLLGKKIMSGKILFKSMLKAFCVDFCNNWIHCHAFKCAQVWISTPLLTVLFFLSFPCADEVTVSLDVCVRQDLLKWLTKETEERGATIIYATHIFDGLDDWATDLFYLTDSGACGWQGKMTDLSVYQELKAKNHPAKMLAIADHWLRAELIRARERKQKEKAQGALAHQLDPTDRQGGYASGRGIKVPEVASTPIVRPGRLSDIMGNSGVLEKKKRVPVSN